jgi:hypothetical protein
MPIPKFTIARHSKTCLNLDVWYENIPSRNPGIHTCHTYITID